MGARRRSGARWLIPIGLLLLAGGIAALIGSGDEDVVNWLKDNATCNERPCTYDEAKSILTGAGVLGTAGGGGLTLFGLWRGLRAGSRAPEAAPSDDGTADPLARLARLDARLAEGELDIGEYNRLRDVILREL